MQIKYTYIQNIIMKTYTKVKTNMQLNGSKYLALYQDISYMIMINSVIKALSFYYGLGQSHLTYRRSAPQNRAK